MKFAKIVFLVAGIYGILVLTPMYFTEAPFWPQSDAGAITRPEFFYGFLGVALSWQFVFLVIASDPARFRPIMFPALFEKLGFGVAVPILFMMNRVVMSMVLAAAIDLVLFCLFVAAILKTRPPKPAVE